MSCNTDNNFPKFIHIDHTGCGTESNERMSDRCLSKQDILFTSPNKCLRQGTLNSSSVQSLNLDASLVSLLQNHGITTIAELSKKTIREIAEFGIQKKQILKILTALMQQK